MVCMNRAKQMNKPNNEGNAATHVRGVAETGN